MGQEETRTKNLPQNVSLVKALVLTPGCVSQSTGLRSSLDIRIFGCINSLKNIYDTGEMAQQLRSLVAPAEDLG